VTLRGTAAPKIPKRGEKDFEPHATTLQSDTLSASRAAMHAALSIPRIHKPKLHNVAVYHVESNMAYIYRPKGNFGRTMGTAKGETLWLLPEEALHLLERGSLDVRWPQEEKIGQDSVVQRNLGRDITDQDGIQGDIAEQDNTKKKGAEQEGAQQETGENETEETEPPSESIGEDWGVPMSLQGAYAAFIGMERSHGGKLTLEMFAVYSSLKRAGFTVARAESWDDHRPPLDTQAMKLGLLPRLRQWWLASGRLPSKQLAHGPLVKPGLYRTYSKLPC
jgi:tRNA-splicing endonuclease subunit Sen54